MFESSWNRLNVSRTKHFPWTSVVVHHHHFLLLNLIIFTTSCRSGQVPNYTVTQINSIRFKSLLVSHNLHLRFEFHFHEQKLQRWQQRQRTCLLQTIRWRAVNRPSSSTSKLSHLLVAVVGCQHHVFFFTFILLFPPSIHRPVSPSLTLTSCLSVSILAARSQFLLIFNATQPFSKNEKSFLFFLTFYFCEIHMWGATIVKPVGTRKCCLAARCVRNNTSW